ncbi:MAG: FAD-dependent thymidylate synthase, partial [Thermoleophilaceae bacterium]
MDYPVESFTEVERASLAPHFTNLDKPVFALTGLPETVKGALFARYSRYPGTLRRLFLDEFAGEVEADGAGNAQHGPGGERAAQLYERIFLGYGDDSVAQLGGAHVGCEWVSNVMTKVLQRGRLAAYLEQSTRYIAYDAPMPGGGYRYWRDPSLGPEYGRAMDALFDLYARALPITER